MWVFTKDGFFSAVVKDPNRPDAVTVRSRVKEDLENLIERLGGLLANMPKKVNITEGEGTDYRFRIVIRKSMWTTYLMSVSDDLDYSNFKSAAISYDDDRRSDAYHGCWQALLYWQETVERDSKNEEQFNKYKGQFERRRKA